jgi:glucokinase
MTLTLAAAVSASTMPWLVADLGGTNARFGWVSSRAAGVEHVRTLAVAQHGDLAAAARAYLAALPPQLGQAAPRRAALAVAGAPLDGDRVEFTNSPWSFSRAALRGALGLELLLVVNDFEALALSLPRLSPAQVKPIGAAAAGARGPLAVIGPGTGLGVAGVVPTAHGWVALPGEGGHATLAAADDFEASLLQHVRCRHEHVSAERLLSGIGLPMLHDAVRALLGAAAEPLGTEEIVARAVAENEPLAKRTVEVFCALLGGFAGNVALTMGARGGLYIGGGIVPRLGERFFESPFRERFVAKGRLRPYLEAIPTWLITDTLAALAGAALAIEQLED